MKAVLRFRKMHVYEKYMSFCFIVIQLPAVKVKEFLFSKYHILPVIYCFLLRKALFLLRTAFFVLSHLFKYSQIEKHSHPALLHMAVLISVL